MDERKYNRKDPWEPGLYETGRTKPPKSHGGLIAFLLVTVILLCGLVSALGLLNIRLFAELNSRQEQDALSFINEGLGDSDPFEALSDAPTQMTLPPEDSKSDAFVLNPSPQSVANVPQEGGLSLQEIYEKTIPSVVSISCQSRSASSTGTGVIISDSGYIVTNHHVVENAESVSVKLTDERVYSASVVGKDEVSDLAVLYIKAENLTPAEFGDSSVLRVGDSVAAIGDPLGAEFRGTLTNGIVSAINRDVTTGGRTLTLIQTNAALNSGNSGGPLINCYGQVIGINTLKIGAFTDDAGVEGLGFAIPSTTVKEIVEQLVSQGYVSGRPTLGIEGESITKFYQAYYRMPAGLYITELDESSDAALSGIAEGDILLNIDDYRITSMDELKAALYNYETGDDVLVVIYRGGRQYSVTLTLHEAKN